MPDTVKYGISNRTWIGGRPSVSSANTLGRPKCALMRKSLPPGNDLMVQTTELVSGEYLQLPAVVLNLGESASTGTGTMISTLLAVDRRLNWLFACKTDTQCTLFACKTVIRASSQHVSTIVTALIIIRGAFNKFQDCPSYLPQRRSIKWCHFQWPWINHNSVFKVRPFFVAE